MYKNITNIYMGFMHQKYFLPAEYDVLITFMPTVSYEGITSTQGKFKVRVMLQGPVTEEQKKDKDVRVLLRPDERPVIVDEDEKEE